MVDISVWLRGFQDALIGTFGQRVWFFGLQGSYARGEATESSDLDPVVILDVVTVDDIRAYGRMLDHLPHRELICGFFSGKAELLNWEAFDLFQFYYDTLPIMGSLDALLPLLDDEVVARAIKVGAGNLYHGCVHNMLHGRCGNTLAGLYKAAAFVVQAVIYRRTGQYCRQRPDLLALATQEEKRILETSAFLKQGGAVDFDPMSDCLFSWVQQLLQ